MVDKCSFPRSNALKRHVKHNLQEVDEALLNLDINYLKRLQRITRNVITFYGVPKYEEKPKNVLINFMDKQSKIM